MIAGPAVDVGQPCLLLARYGENTWGHWVTEMLVKAVIAERLLPGRFFYAVPWWTTEPGAANGLADAVLGSLAAYGIEPQRLVRLGPLHRVSIRRPARHFGRLRGRAASARVGKPAPACGA